MERVTSMQLQRAAQDLLCKCSGMWLLPVATGMTQNKARRRWWWWWWWLKLLKEWANDRKGRVGFRIVGRQRWEESRICVGLFGDDDDERRMR
jgi:hypothetical protein